MAPSYRPNPSVPTASNQSEVPSAAASATGSTHGADPKRHPGLASVAQQKAPPRPPSRSNSTTGPNTGKQPTQRTVPAQSNPALSKFYSTQSSEPLLGTLLDQAHSPPKSQLKISSTVPLLRATPALPLERGVIPPPIQENATGVTKFRPQPIRHQGRVHLGRLRVRVPLRVRPVTMKTVFKIPFIMANPIRLLISPVVGVAVSLQPPLLPRQGAALPFALRTSPDLNTSTAESLVKAPLATPQKSIAFPNPGGVAPGPNIPLDTSQRHKSMVKSSMLQAIPIHTPQL
jgi:hypothetical protein